MNPKLHRRLEARVAKLADREIDPDNGWYCRGELAFGLGQARALPDGRASLKNREHFYAGWDAASRRKTSLELTPEQRAEHRARFDRLKEFCRAL